MFISYAIHPLLQNTQADMRRVSHIVVDPLGCLNEIVIRAFIDIHEFLGISVDKREP
jgi:hypothetical protein